MAQAQASVSLMSCRQCYEFKAYVKHIESNGIYVADLPPYVEEEEVYKFFSWYGRIADFYFADTGLYCLVNFHDNGPLAHLLSYPIVMHGKRLRIRKRHQNNKPGQDNADDDALPKYFNELHALLFNKKNFKEQAEEFLRFLEADESDFLNRIQVCRNLEFALKGLSATYKIQPFGSSVNGLAFKDSDVDIFYGKVPGSTGPEVSNVFNRVVQVLQKNPNFTSVNPIPNARVPIIKLVHKATGCHCDLSFKNTMGVQNSQLIKFLTTLDTRIKPLFMIVKFWAKLHHLTGKRMSNYALIMLLINFLQSLAEPILPPLSKLKHDGIARIKVADWSVNFDYENDTRLRPVCNVLPVEELLVRFFESVVKTDFDNYVVSPLEGNLIHKGYFHDLNLPAEMNDYLVNVRKGKEQLKMESVLCIQDPIELNLNLTKNVSKHDFQCFKDHCQVAANISYKEPPHLFLSKLLSDAYYVDSGKKSWHLNPMHVPVKPLRPYMTLNIPIPDSVADRISWRNELVYKLKIILKKVLKIDVDHKTEEKDTKPGADQNLICQGSQVLWRQRDELWNRWHAKEKGISKSNNVNEEEVQVVYLKDDDEQNPSSSMKRKRDEEEPATNKKRHIDQQDNKNEEAKELVGEDVIIIEPAETLAEAGSSKDETAKNTSSKRCLQDEINLTNDMVKRKHALPASKPILRFSCNICLDVNSARIEISDLRSVNNYFNSLCSFLESFIVPHTVQVGSD